MTSPQVPFHNEIETNSLLGYIVQTSWVYSWWFTLLTFIALRGGCRHFSRPGGKLAQRPSGLTICNKTWGDVFGFYVLAVAILASMSLPMGMPHKHYGARVPAMGFLLIYLTPAFYTDTTEGYVLATKYQRIVIVIAGVWSELMICALATPIWWGTAPNTARHNAAYMVMLMTGIAAILLNWNPLMKLDGYQMLTEIIGVAELKEDSTAYISAWVKRHIWRLPVEIPFVPKQRRLGFAVYALLSGTYSYTVLYVLAHFAGNVFRNFNPEWSFIPELAVAGLIFRSRIRRLVNFMKFVYLDKKDRIRAWFTLRHSLAVTAGLFVVLILPLRHESTTGRFVLEPIQRSVIRTVVPGTVTDVYASEGQSVTSGAPLIRLRNLPLNRRSAKVRPPTKLRVDQCKHCRYFLLQISAWRSERVVLTNSACSWNPASVKFRTLQSVRGRGASAAFEDRLGAFLPGLGSGGGGRLAADACMCSASEHDMFKFWLGSPAKLACGQFFLRKWQSRVSSIAAISSQSDPRVAERIQYSGLNSPMFCVLDLAWFPNLDSLLKPGMVGTARISGAPRSIAGLAWENG